MEWARVKHPFSWFEVVNHLYLYPVSFQVCNLIFFVPHFGLVITSELIPFAEEDFDKQLNALSHKEIDLLELWQTVKVMTMICF